MKTLVLLFFLNVNLMFAQYNIEYAYTVCNSIFLMELNRNFDKQISEKFVLNKELSCAYYIDFDTKLNIKLEFRDSKNSNCVPYQFVLNYHLIDEESNVIQSFNISFFYKDGILQMDSLANLKDFFRPYTLLIENKLISLNKALLIAVNKGYRATLFELKYYNFNKRKVIWAIKELVKNEKNLELYYKVILINAKNGKVLKEYQEFLL
jgi:hypothetical protein